MILLPPISTRTSTLFPNPTLCRSLVSLEIRIDANPDASVVNTSQRPAANAFTTSLNCSMTTGLYSTLLVRAQSAIVFSFAVPVCMHTERPLRPWHPEEHTSELQSLMRTPYAVSCFKNKKQVTTIPCHPLRI